MTTEFNAKNPFDDIPNADHWVFGYASLMWRPGFEALEAVRARVIGYHRQLCVYSYEHRGTKARPGLVMGLMPGGTCIGMAFRVAPEKWKEIHAYLHEREQITRVYRETLVSCQCDQGMKFKALGYVVDRKHPQYAGNLEPEEISRLVRQGIGKSGHCRDYVVNTHNHLEELNIRDRRLENVVRLIQD